MFTKLSAKFTLLMVGLFLLTLGTSYWGFRELMSAKEGDLRSLFAQRQALYDKERSLRPFLKELSLAQRLAHSPLIRQWSLNEQEPQLKRQALRELESYRRDFADQSYFFAIAESGNYYFNDAADQYRGRQLRYRLERGNPEHQWFYKTMAQNKPCLLNVDYDEELKVSKVWVNCRVTAQGQPTAVIGTGLDLDNFIDQVILDNQPGLSKFFVDAAGAIQAHQDTDLIDFRSITKTADRQKTLFQLIDDPKERQALRDAMARLEAGQVEAVSLPLHLDGQLYMSGLARIPQIDWYNVSLMEMGVWIDEDFFEPFSLLLGLALLLLAGFSLLVSKWLFLDRLAQLNRGANAVAAGNFHPDLPNESSDELGHLARSFEAMAQKLEQHTQNLERKVAQRTATLEASNAERERLLSILAHDLKAPIGSISVLFNEVVQTPADFSEELLELVRINAQSTYNLLSELLSWAQNQRGELEFRPVAFDLGKLFDENQRLFLAQASLKQVKLQFNRQGQLWVRADRAMVHTMLRNLINNALKFTESGGQVEVEAQVHGGEVKVVVIDTGVGLSAEQQEDLFALDRKPHSSLGTQSEAGTGMGLVLCRELAHRQGGQIGVSSRPQEGSRFWFTLPQAARPQAKGPLRLDGLTFLVANSSALQRETATQTLKSAGAEVSLAATGTEAVQQASQQTFDWILIDLDLEVIDGLEAARRILHDNSQTKLLALTAYSQKQLEQRGGAELFDGLLSQPLALEELAPFI